MDALDGSDDDDRFAVTRPDQRLFLRQGVPERALRRRRKAKAELTTTSQRVATEHR